MALPVAAILCICIVIYVAFVVIFLLIWSLLQSRGMCVEYCAECCRTRCKRCDACDDVSGDRSCSCCCCPETACCRNYVESACPSRKGVMLTRCAGCAVCLQTTCDSCAKLGTAEGPSCQCDAADIITCQCCTDPSNRCCPCCHSTEPLCDCCSCNGRCCCPVTDCNEINCCFFTIVWH